MQYVIKVMGDEISFPMTLTIIFHYCIVYCIVLYNIALLYSIFLRISLKSLYFIVLHYCIVPMTFVSNLKIA